MIDPAITVLSAKMRLGLSAASNHRDEEIRDLLFAAIAHVESLSQRYLSRREVDVPIEVNRLGQVEVHAWPDPVLVAVTYFDAYGAAQAVAAPGDLRFDVTRSPGLIYVNGGGWPSDFSYGGVATVLVGYADADAIPPQLSQAVLVLVSQWFDDPAGERPISDHVKALCRKFRSSFI